MATCPMVIFRAFKINDASGSNPSWITRWIAGKPYCVMARAISSQAPSGKVQRLSRNGVEPSGSKRRASLADGDIVWTAWRHAAARKSGARTSELAWTHCKIIKEPEISVSAYSRGTTVSAQDLDDADFSLVIDKANYFAFKMDDVEESHA